jgi:hypothetical protein
MFERIFYDNEAFGLNNKFEVEKIYENATKEIEDELQRLYRVQNKRKHTSEANKKKQNRLKKTSKTINITHQEQPLEIIQKVDLDNLDALLDSLIGENTNPSMSNKFKTTENFLNKYSNIH